MPYNLSIPGQVSEFQLQAIEAVASLAPANGKVVEVGSLFGRSSWAWAKSVDPSVTVYCIDPWRGNEGVRNMETIHGVLYGLEQFKTFTADCPNLRPLQGYSPNDFESWSDPIDIYYEDAVHAGPVLAKNLNFWSGWLKSTGIACGDDYRPRFPDVRAGAELLSNRFGRELLQVGFFWCLLPDETILSGSAKVAQTLRDLGKANDAFERSRALVLSIGPKKPIGVCKKGETVSVACLAANQSLDAWPPVAGEPLAMGVRIVSPPEPHVVLAETLTQLPCRQLSPDVPVEFTLELPISALAAGSYSAVFSLHEIDAQSAIRSSPARTKGYVFQVEPS